MHLASNPEVVDRLIGAYSPRSGEQLATMVTQLSQALHVSQARPDLYNLPLDGALQPNVALSEQVHPWNLSGALLSAITAAPAFGLLLPVPELWVWISDWKPLRELSFEPRPLATAPAPADAAATLTSPASQGAPAGAGADVSPQPAAEAQPEPSVTRTEATSGLPGTNVTASVTSPKGRPQKSAFDREYRPRERLGAMPTWWTGTVTVLREMFSSEPAEILRVENSPSPVMEFGLAVDLARKLLDGAPPHARVQDLQDWLRQVTAAIEASQSGPVAFDLANHLAAQRAEALKKQEASNE